MSSMSFGLLIAVVLLAESDIAAGQRGLMILLTIILGGENGWKDGWKDGKSQPQRSRATRQSKEVKAHREHSFGRLPE
jgi:hypothetical protein